MRILITAGGTSEKIDEVRKITNTASGRLGTLIAEEFIAQTKILGKEVEITYICGMDAVTPVDNTDNTGNTKIDIRKISSVDMLRDVISKLLTQNEFDAVIHTMAVSDYAVRSVMSIEDLTAAIAKKVMQNSHSVGSYDDLIYIMNTEISQNIIVDEEHYKNKKISSNVENLIIFMNKTPKVIKLIKQLQPNTILVGFKLLVDVSEDELLRVGHELLVKNNCDFVLANDLEKIYQDSHVGLLIKPDFSHVQLNSKREIAKAITSSVLAKIESRSEK